MKTPDEIKKGLECCLNQENKDFVCDECPYCNAGSTCGDLFGDALAYIRQLDAQVPKWISVEERLPKGLALAVNRRGVMLIGWIEYRSYDKKDGFICQDPDSGIGIGDVTHWMPLPSTEGLHDD